MNVRVDGPASEPFEVEGVCVTTQRQSYKQPSGIFGPSYERIIVMDGQPGLTIGHLDRWGGYLNGRFVAGGTRENAIAAVVRAWLGRRAVA